MGEREDFATNSAVSLIGGGKTIAAAKTTCLFGLERWQVAIDCSLLAPGTTYDVQVTASSTTPARRTKSRAMPRKGVAVKPAASAGGGTGSAEQRAAGPDDDGLRQLWRNQGSIDLAAPVFGELFRKGGK